MLRRYVEQILSLYNYVDGLIVTDKDGYIEYYLTYRPDISTLREKDVLRKHITEIYPFLTEQSSSIMRVLHNGKPIFNEYQKLITYNGQILHVVNTTMPIKANDQIIGAIDVSRYVDSSYERRDIRLSLKEKEEEKTLYTVDDIITNSQNLKVIKNRIPMVAETDSSVLIYGETGTGKELVAQSIHMCSRRREKRFISQNCAAIPGNLLESILFGTTKGSYTGAENKPGLFEIANGGTLFLDEINSMEYNVQSKILRAIEEKQVTRLGGYEPIKIDVKIISAINVNPLQCVVEKKIREDLFYRLSVVQLNIPPLREREDDIPVLTAYFIHVFNEMMGRNIMNIDEEVEAIFRNYKWPGNVRELRNVIEGAFNVASGRLIQKKDLPDYLTEPVAAQMVEQSMLSAEECMFEEGFSLEGTVSALEKKILEKALAATRNQAEAARILGISRQTLNYKIIKYQIGR